MNRIMNRKHLNEEKEEKSLLSCNKISRNKRIMHNDGNIVLKYGNAMEYFTAI